jgi:hypothetical protein
MEEDPPEEPPKKGYFYGRRKRGRSLSRHQSSKNNQKSSFRPSSRSSGETVQPRPTATSRERDRDREQGQKRKITKKELLSALKKTQKEVEEKQLLLAASQKKCSQLSTKNSSLVVGIRDARSQARSSKAATARADRRRQELLPSNLIDPLLSCSRRFLHCSRHWPRRRWSTRKPSMLPWRRRSRM